ncbi:MAG: GNAT family N-acetyltransferase [Thermoplasmata archaeon]
MDALLSARGARRDTLEELANAVRRELTRRGEAPPPSWVEELAEELASGRTPGWYQSSEAGSALGFYSRRPTAAFGHVHVDGGSEAVERAIRLIDAIRADLPPEVANLDIGFTGLQPDEEGQLGARLEKRRRVAVLRRMAMDRPITEADARPISSVPVGIRHYPVRSIPREALVELDYRAFQGTIDAHLIGTERAEYARMMDELVSGRLGRFVDEASTTLVDATSGALWGGILTAEQNPRLAIYLDVMVEPSQRRHGLGRYLVRWGFRALSALGYTSVRLWVTEGNVPARTLYEALGFSRVASAIVYRESGPIGQPQLG